MTVNISSDEAEIQTVARKLVQGDTDALEQILRLLGPVVAARLQKRFGSFLGHEDVEDILGIALHKLWEARNRYDPSRPLFPWFYLIARNVALDWLRDKRRHLELHHLSHEGEQRVVQPPVRVSSKVPTESTSELMERLQEVLQSLTEQDQEILLDFARSEDSGNWAGEIANRIGKSANYVRVRKKRLMERVREQLSLPPVPTEPQEDYPMKPVEHLIKLWDPFRTQFREMAAYLHEACAKAISQGPNHPRQVFARAWNASQEDGSLENESYRRILQRTHGWIEGLLRKSEDCRSQIIKFARQCREDDRLKTATLYLDPPPTAAERLLRAVGGVASAIEERMPESVRREQQGILAVKWDQSEPWFDGYAHWQAKDARGELRLRPITCSSFRLYAELPAGESEIFAHHLLLAVRARRVTIPDFNWKEEGKEYSVFVWQPEGVRAVSEKEAPGARERLPEDRDLLPFPIELDLWEKHPEAAQAVDNALLEAVLADERSRQGEPFPMEKRDKPIDGSEVEQVVRALQELSGYPVEDVVLLLTPRLEKRIQEKCEDDTCDAYRHALEILASRLSQP